MKIVLALCLFAGVSFGQSRAVYVLTRSGGEMVKIPDSWKVGDSLKTDISAISTGAAPVAGNATLVGGTATVSTTAVTASSIVMLTRKTRGGTVGSVITYTISAGTSFTINSDNSLDTSTFSWFIVRLN